MASYSRYYSYNADAENDAYMAACQNFNRFGNEHHTTAEVIALEHLRPAILAMAPDTVYKGGLTAYLEAFMIGQRNMTSWHEVEGYGGRDIQLVFDLIHETRYLFAVVLHLSCTTSSTADVDFYRREFCGHVKRRWCRNGLSGFPGPPSPFQQTDIPGVVRFEKVLVDKLLDRRIYSLMYERGVRDGVLADVCAEMRFLVHENIIQTYLLHAVELDGAMARFLALAEMMGQVDHAETGEKMCIQKGSVSIGSGAKCRIVYSPQTGYEVVPAFVVGAMHNPWTPAMKAEAIDIFERLHARFTAHAIALAAMAPKCVAAWAYLYMWTDVTSVSTKDGGEVLVAEYNERLNIRLFLKTYAKDHWTPVTHMYGDLLYGKLSDAEQTDVHARQVVLRVDRHMKTLLATLMLGIQRLEGTQRLLLAHQAMFEEMLECLVRADMRSQ